MALVVEFGERIDRSVSSWVHALDKRLTQMQVTGISELIPTFRSLMIHFEPVDLDRSQLIERIYEALDGLTPEMGSGRLWLLPVCYETEMAPDLALVADAAGLTIRATIDRHSETEYHVYMLGFLPGQAYMGDNPPEIILPRRKEPRLKIPAGTLAIAMDMTSIFPQETPCGWHLIGRSPVPMWDYRTNAEPLLRPNDRVRFRPVTSGEFRKLQSKMASGEFDLTPEQFAAEFQP